MALCLANAIAFCGQDSGRSRQGFGKILTGAAKILSNSLRIRERQERSGVRRALDLFSGLGKSLPERNLWIPWAARVPPHSTPDVPHCLLFFGLFLDRFLEGLFSIFGDF